MKALSFKKNSTNSFYNFKTYESAEFNEPYIAAVFNASMVNEGYRSLTLGKKITTFDILARLIFCFLFTEFMIAVVVVVVFFCNLFPDFK